MNQLIPLIIAVILGGFATVLSLVLIGPQFSERSADIKAQQFATDGSAIEASMRIYKTERSDSAYDQDFATTMVDATDQDGLIDLGYLTQTPVAPQGVYSLEEESGKVYLVATGSDITEDVCKAVVELDDGPLAAGYNVQGAGSDRATDMSGSRLHCVENATNAGEYELIFTVE
tara:strand:- start:642 stop:1163 length:522 start_codon:yes stop_codon:yes gene_type:complete